MVSPIGTCYRIGGDEFAVICRNIDETTVKKSISKIKRRLAAESPDDAYCVSLAVGYAFGGGITDTPKQPMRLTRSCLQTCEKTPEQPKSGRPGVAVPYGKSKKIPSSCENRFLFCDSVAE